MIRTRFAPSPTGFLHVGALRTALFSYLYAKANSGKFILRIEDTDRERFVEGATENIIESMNWAGINFDEGPHYQSKRLEEYKTAADSLVKAGLAYEDEGALRFRIPKGAQVKFDDVIRGEISFDTDTLEDFVIIKKDGFPTYNFANVVDDAAFKISHVIRGEEFVSSTPKHILLYEALGLDKPVFAHLSPILGPDRTKLSKRHGAKPVLEYRDEGILPAALINFLALLGWHPKDEKEVFGLDQLVKLFDLKDVQKSPAIFDSEKLLWFNGEYLKRLDDGDWMWWADDGYESAMDETDFLVIQPLLKTRVRNFAELRSQSAFFFWRNQDAPKKVLDYKLENKGEVLASAIEILDAMIRSWPSRKISGDIIGGSEAIELERHLRDKAAALKVKTGDYFMLVRLAITGSNVSPPLIPSMLFINLEESKSRLELALQELSKSS